MELSKPGQKFIYRVDLPFLMCSDGNIIMAKSFMYTCDTEDEAIDTLVRTFPTEYQKYIQQFVVCTKIGYVVESFVGTTEAV